MINTKGYHHNRVNAVNILYLQGLVLAEWELDTLCLVALLGP